VKILFILIILILFAIIIGINFNVYATCIFGPNGTKSCVEGPLHDIVVNTDSAAYAGNDTVIISGTVDKYILSNYGTPLYIEIYNPQMVLYKSDKLNANTDGSFTYSFGLEGKNATNGFYNVHVGSDLKTGYYGTGFMYQTTPSPLHQFKTGTVAKDVKCNDSLFLVIKAEDGSPACVKPDTAQKLIERGWAKEIVPTNQTSLNQNSNSSRTIPNPMADLENNVGIVNWKNQTYYFETPNYTETASGHPAQILFHDVIFTLFPSSFGGMSFSSCEGMYYLADAKFSDGTSEILNVFVSSPSCGYDYTPIKLSTQTNPQAGLTVYDGKMKLLTSVENK